jgi:tetratricopeptide (TPR) repeat protein
VGSSRPDLAEATTVTSWIAQSDGRSDADSAAALVVGHVLGGRYEIQAQIGQGGMGTVYKALDRELDRVSALKVIRNCYANQPAMLTRFKRELVLARQITHPNVIRIFDLGMVENIRFITMEFVEGRALSDVLHERSKLSAAEAVSIVDQVCEGLAAAHKQGVIHRDLKPSNIMMAAYGRCVIMDFGIARTVDRSTLTNTGAIIGTPLYMSPEQVWNKGLDSRSDLYTLGVIFYEMLTGKLPFEADNVMNTLIMRCQQDPVPPIQVDPAVPQALNKIVLKAMAREPEKRYQSAEEMLDDLREFEGRKNVEKSRKASTLALVAMAAIVLVLAGLLVYSRLKGPGPAVDRKAVTVLVADFDNNTSEPVFDGTLEPVFIAGLEGASFVSTFSPSAARKLAGGLKPGATRLNEVLARLIATREGINVILTGLIARQGDGYRVTINAIDGPTGKGIVTRDSATVQKEGVLAETAKLVPALRRALGDMSPLEQMKSSGETFTSSSLEAVHDYGAAQQLQWAGKFEEAAKLYLAAAKADPQFGRAYAGLAVMSFNLGRAADSEKYYKIAMKELDRMTDREKFRTRGGYFLDTRDPKAINEFSSLVAQYPYDTAGYANLALAYCYARDMAKAVQEGRKAIELYAGNAIQRNNVAFYMLYSGDLGAAQRESKAVLARNPSYEKAFAVTAMAQVIDGQLEAGIKTYDQLRGISQLGSAMALTGQADLAMYQGRFAEAISMIEKGTPADTANPANDSALAKILIEAEAQLALNRPEQAVRLARRALDLNEKDAVAVIAARVFMQAHQEKEAQRLAATLQQRLSPEPRAWAKVIEGEILLTHGKTADAIQALNDSQKHVDTWMSHFDLARAYVQAGAHVDAHSELDLCLKRRGEASSVFIEDYLPTVRYLAPVYYYAGRAQDGLGNPQNAESYYRSFLQIKGQSEADPLVTEARTRLASR